MTKREMPLTNAELTVKIMKRWETALKEIVEKRDVKWRFGMAMASAKEKIRKVRSRLGLAMGHAPPKVIGANNLKAAGPAVGTGNAAGGGATAANG